MVSVPYRTNPGADRVACTTVRIASRPPLCRLHTSDSLEGTTKAEVDLRLTAITVCWDPSSTPRAERLPVDLWPGERRCYLVGATLSVTAIYASTVL